MVCVICGVCVLYGMSLTVYSISDMYVCVCSQGAER